MVVETPARAAVEAYLAWLEATGASRAVRRQRAWALRDALAFAGERGGSDGSGGPAPVPLGQLLATGFCDDWATRDDAPGPTRRARLTSLRALAAFAQATPPDHLSPRPVLRDVLEPPRVEAALRALAGPLPGRGHDDHVRLAAVLAVMSVWPARSGELCTLRLDDVHDDGAQVRLAVPGAGGPLLLGAVAADRVREWLVVRATLAAGLQGGPVQALWTSIRSNSRPGGRRGSLPLPAGMPLRPRGLQRAYARSVSAANVAHHGSAGFPLPGSLDLLRRSLAVPTWGAVITGSA